MQKLKSNFPNMVAVLTGVALVCGFLLAYANQLTSATIEQQRKQATADAVKAVLQAEQVTVNDTKTVKRTVNGKELEYVVYSTDKGTAVESTSNGFGGNLKVMVGFAPDGTILGYNVLEHAETPGLGAKAGEWFQQGAPGCIVGLNPATTNLTVKKDGGTVDAITASTITSRAFLKAVQEAYNTIQSEK